MPVILLAIFIDLIGFGIIIPILPFLAKTYGASSFTATSLMSIYALTAFAIGPLWGKLSDQVGRKPVLVLTFIGAAFAYLLLAVSSSLWMVFLARAISGAMTGNVGIVMAIMADISDDESRGKAMGQIGAAFGLGFAFGPGLGGYLSGLTGQTSVFLPGMVACGLSLTAMVLTAVYVPETRPKKLQRPDTSSIKPVPPGPKPQTPVAANWKSIVLDPLRAPLFAMFIISATGQSISFAITPFWAESVLGWDALYVGFLLMSVGVFVFVTQLWAVGPMFKAFGEIRSLQFCSLFHVAGCLIIYFGPPTILTAAIGFPLVMGALTMSYPALNSLLSRRTDRDTQGTTLGLSNGLSSLGRIAGPILAGLTFSPLAPGFPYLIVMAIGIYTFVWTWREHRRSLHT